MPVYRPILFYSILFFYSISDSIQERPLLVWDETRSPEAELHTVHSFNLICVALLYFQGTFDSFACKSTSVFNTSTTVRLISNFPLNELSLDFVVNYMQHMA